MSMNLKDKLSIKADQNSMSDFDIGLSVTFADFFILLWIYYD